MLRKKTLSVNREYAYLGVQGENRALRLVEECGADYVT
jgi:hypothetical protein